MPATYPGGSNTFVPSHEASGKLQIEFSRNPNSFPLNRYCGFKTVKESIGYYLEITAEEAARVVKIEDYEWPDGQDAPSGYPGTELFQFKPFTTHRFSYPYTLGDKAVKQATWDVLAAHGRMYAQKAMTSRTKRALNILTVAGNWSGNTATATSLGGGKWDASSASNQYILKGFNAVKEAVHTATVGAVPPEALRCVIAPELAHAIRESEEIIDYVKQNPTALATLQGNQFYERWGVPPTLYGVKMVVEDTVLVSTRKGGTQTKAHMLDPQVAIFTAVPEGLESSREPADGAPTFNTMTIFSYEDLSVESRRDDDNRRHLARVVDDTDEVLTAPASGYLVTAASDI